MITQSIKHISSNHIEITTFNNDTLYTIEVIDIYTCKLNGPYKKYYPDGQLSYEVNYLNGEPHGLFKSYYLNGQLSGQTNYLNGERHGYCKSYYHNGKLSYETTYVKGKQHGSYKAYFDNGKLLNEKNYINGIEQEGQIPITHVESDPQK